MAFAFAVFGAWGQADALELKDPIPDNLTWYGVTLYGTIDVGYAYQNHGAKLDSTFPQKLEYNIWGAKNASKRFGPWTRAPLNGQASVDKIEEPLGGGWVGLGMLDTSFSPLSGRLADGPASLLRNFGVPLAEQSANGRLEPRGPVPQRRGLWRHQQFKLRNANFRAPANAVITTSFWSMAPGCVPTPLEPAAIRRASAARATARRPAGIIRSDIFISTERFMPPGSTPAAARVPVSSEMPTSLTRAAPMAVSRPMPSFSGWTPVSRFRREQHISESDDFG